MFKHADSVIESPDHPPLRYHMGSLSPIDDEEVARGLFSDYA